MKRKWLLLLIPVIAIITAIACVNVLTAPIEETESEDSTIKDTQDESDNEPLLLYSDDICEVSYIEVFDYKDVYGDEVQDLEACYIRLLVKNNSKKQINVILSDVSVNGMMTEAFRGMPMIIEPGMKSKEPFFVSYTNLDIKEKSQLEEIQFKIWIVDENFDTMLKTDPVKIEF